MNTYSRTDWCLVPILFLILLVKQLRSNWFFLIFLLLAESLLLSWNGPITALFYTLDMLELRKIDVMVQNPTILLSRQ